MNDSPPAGPYQKYIATYTHSSVQGARRALKAGRVVRLNPPLRIVSPGTSIPGWYPVKVIETSHEDFIKKFNPYWGYALEEAPRPGALHRIILFKNNEDVANEIRNRNRSAGSAGGSSGGDAPG